ncbi:MAG TPA: nitrilase family protein [Niabella sp.]|nr:nitrilase family protein [Niabella sp.]HOZ98243.1 nitrilase family protein [Niabella sp.]HQW13197.1 nitrilase family protein [Niabella sp.]HQX18763.1 nitrilase family protein [Niabella sp.]HQX41153.1 nitrilase family protein [Niabella sp.]
MSNKLLITLVQTHLVWENKAANLKNLQEKIKTLEEKSNIVVLPEMFSTGFTMNAAAMAETMDGPTLAWMRQIAIEKRIILTGSIIVKEKNNSGHETYFNRLIWMLPNGQYGQYDKRHLFSFANEDQYYTAGNKRLLASVNDWKINLQICYDLRFPVWARQTPPTRKENPSGLYDVLIYVANWPERRRLAWITLLQARAIENQCYVIGVNRIGKDGHQTSHCGDSMVIDPLGEILYHKKDAEEIFTIALDKKHLHGIREKFTFWQDADEFSLFE